MPGSPQFVMFGTLHLLSLAALVAVSALLLTWARRYSGQRAGARMAKALGVCLLCQELLDRSLHYFLNGEPLAECLPLHLCGLSVVLSGIMLLTRSYRLFELLYFWAVPSGTLAVLTPDMPFRFPHPLYITFFANHGMLVISVIYAAIAFKFRPTLRSFARAAIMLDVLLMAIAIINLPLGTNYFYLRQKPPGDTLFNFLGPWPWYILSLHGLGLVAFTAVYSPYLWFDLKVRARWRRAVSPAVSAGGDADAAL